MKKHFNFKRILTSFLAVVITLTCFAVAPAAAVQMTDESTYGFISEYKDFYENYKEAVDTVVEGALNMQTTFKLAQYKIPIEDLLKFLDVVKHTHPELFYISERSMRSTTTGTDGKEYVSTLVLHWGKFIYDDETGDQIGEITYTDEEVLAMRKTFVEKAQWYLDKVDDSMSDFEKALVLHEALVMNSSYLISGAIYDLMVEGRGKCYGYSEVYSYLLAQVGIYSEIVESDSMFHQWNKVKIGEHYYHVDVTWDDSVPDSPGFVRHTYFMLSDSKIQSLSNPHYDYVSDFPSDDTSFDESYFHKINTQFSYANGAFYVVDNNKEVKAMQIYNSENDSYESVIDYSDVTWTASSGGFYSRMFMSLDVYDGFLYMNTQNMIIAFDTLTGEMSTFAENTAEHSFYGLRVIDGKVYAAMADTPNEQAQLQYIGDCLTRELIMGDLNGDNLVTIEDVTIMQRALAEFIALNPVQLECADFNRDGVVNIRDVTAMQRFLASYTDN